MPRWAAPNATKVATSNERTRMMSRSGWLVAKRSWRASGSAKAISGSMSAAARRGDASFRIRPFGTARISFSLASLDKIVLTSNKRPPLVGAARLLDEVGGLPRGRPRLPDIPQMARKPADFQSYGTAGGKAQRHRAVLFLAHGQQFQHPIGLLKRDLVMMDGLYLVENKGRMGPPIGRLDGRVRLPAEPVQQENKALLIGKEGTVAH